MCVRECDSLAVGRIPWLRRVRLENPLGHRNFLTGLNLSGERNGGLGLARFGVVCPLNSRTCTSAYNNCRLHCVAGDKGAFTGHMAAAWACFVG
jgi:hypothetical protein